MLSAFPRWVALAGFGVVATSQIAGCTVAPDDAMIGDPIVDEQRAYLDAFLASPEYAALVGEVEARGCPVDHSLTAAAVLNGPVELLGGRHLGLALAAGLCPDGKEALIFGVIADDSVIEGGLIAGATALYAEEGSPLLALSIEDGALVARSGEELLAASQAQSATIANGILASVQGSSAALSDPADEEIGAARAAQTSCREEPRDFVAAAGGGDSPSCRTDCLRCQAMTAAFQAEVETEHIDYGNRRSNWIKAQNVFAGVAVTAGTIALACASTIPTVVAAIPGGVCAAVSGGGAAVAGIVSGVISLISAGQQRHYLSLMGSMGDITDQVQRWGDAQVGYQAVCFDWGFCCEQPRCTTAEAPTACLPWSYEANGCYEGAEVPPCACLPLGPDSDYPDGGICRMSAGGTYQCVEAGHICTDCHTP